MKNSLIKIIGLSFLSVIAVIGIAIGVGALQGIFNPPTINITKLQFESIENNNFIVADNFTARILYEPNNATNLDLILSVDRGSDVVTVPANVKAGEPFAISLKKNEFGNVGGYVEISARSGYTLSTDISLKFIVDIAIPNASVDGSTGLQIATTANNNTLIANDDSIFVYVFTNPNFAIYPDKSLSTNILDTYKKVVLTSNNNNSLRVLNNGVGAEGYGYYNENYKTNGQLPFSATQTSYHTKQIPYIRFEVKPLDVSDSQVRLSATAFRTYFMKDDFVDINDSKFTNSIQAYAEFSNYLDKYKDYIRGNDNLNIAKDLRSYSEGIISYTDGKNFIDSITDPVSGKVVIRAGEDIQHRAAIYYLTVDKNVEFSIQNVEIQALEVKDTQHVVDLFDGFEFDVDDLVETFDLDIIPKESTFTSEMKNNLLKQVKIAALKGELTSTGDSLRRVSQFDTNSNGVLDTNEINAFRTSKYYDIVDEYGFDPYDLNNDGLYTGEELNLVLLTTAGQQFSIINPTSPASGVWSIQSLDAQENSSDGLRFRFYIINGDNVYYDDVLVYVQVNSITNFRLNNIDNLVINERLNQGQSENKTYILDANSYVLQGISDSPSYNTVKFFVTKDSVKNSTGFYTLRLNSDYSAPFLYQLNVGGNIVEAYEVTYSTASGIILEALNVSDAGPVRIFAAVVKTNYLGQPVNVGGEVITESSTGDANNYQVIRKTDDIEINIGAYVEELNYYTVNTSTGIYTKRNVDDGGGLNEVTLLVNGRYEFVVTNLELDANGNFNIDAISELDLDDNGQLDDRKYFNSEYIDYQTNLTYALRKDAFGFVNNNSPAENFTFFINNENNDDSILRVVQGLDKETYYYDANRNFIIVTVETNPSEFENITHIKGQALPNYLFGLSGLYQHINPVDLSSDAVAIRVVFASLEDDIQITSNSLIVDGEILLTSTATDGKIVWQNSSETPFALEGVAFNFDIERQNGNGKLDVSFNSTSFVSSYLDQLTNSSVTIVWSLKDSNDLEYVSISQDENNLPILTIKKGEVGGKLVTIVVNIFTYPNANSVYIQNYSGELKLRLKQDNLHFSAYSILNNEAYEDHLASNAQKALPIGSGNSLDLFNTFEGAGLLVYDYSNESNPIPTQVYANKLIDVYFQTTNASIIGDLEFQINQISQSLPNIYFLNDDLEKVYTTSAKSIYSGSDVRYQLTLYAESIVNQSGEIETITIRTPFGSIYTYRVSVISNLTVTVPTQSNLSVNDNSELDFNESINAQYYTRALNGSSNVLIELPISFELDGYGGNYAELTTSSHLYDVGIATNLSGIRQTAAYTIDSYNGTVYVAQSFNSKIVPFTVSETKILNLRFYYYVPALDEQGKNIYVNDQGYRIYYNSQSDQYYTIVGGVNIEYTGSQFFYLFEKKEYISDFNKILINPSVEVRLGNYIPSSIEIDSGTDSNLYNVIATTLMGTNFIDVINKATNTLLLPGDIVLGEAFDYSEIYKRYFRLEFDTSQLNSEQLVLFNNLNPTILNGLLTSNAINFNLNNILLRVVLLEGKSAGDGIPQLTGITLSDRISLKFLSSVYFSVSPVISIDDDTYNNSLDETTQTPIGHTFSNINNVKDVLGQNTITLQEKTINLYNSANTSIGDNLVNIIGNNYGINIDLLKEYLTDIKIYYYNGTSFVEYLENNKVVEIVRNTDANGHTLLINLKLLRAVNQTTKFKLAFIAGGLDNLVGNYYFSVVSNVSLNSNYPVYENYEVVTNGTQINLLENYINQNNRTTLRYNNANYKLQQINVGGQSALALVKETDADDFIVIKTTAGAMPTQDYFKYYLMDASKNYLTSVAEINKTFPFSSTNFNGEVFSFSNITTSKTYYIRIFFINGAYLDYRVQLAPSILKDTITTVHTISNPKVLNAGEPLYLNSYFSTNGLNNNIIIKYDIQFGEVAAQYRNGSTGDFSDIIPSTNLLYNSEIIFDNISEEKLIRFLIYSKTFTNGDIPTILYVRVVPNLIITVNNLFVPSGIELDVSNELFTFSGNASDVSVSIETINSSPYSLENIYGIYIANNKFYSDYLSGNVTVKFKIQKEFENFDGDIVALIIFKEITLVPNVKFNLNYNSASFHQLTAASIGDGEDGQDLILHSTSDNSGIVKINDYNNNAITVNHKVTFSIPENDFAQIVEVDGGFTVLRYFGVNAVANLTLKITVEWLDENELPFENRVYVEQSYNVVINPFVPNSTSVLYSNLQSNSLGVFEGSTIELDFNQPQTKFAEQNNESLKIAIMQNSTYVNLVVIEQETEDYIIYSETIGVSTKYYISFKTNLALMGSEHIVLINLYLDLTGNFNHIEETENIPLLYNNYLQLRFRVKPAVTGFNFKPDYINYGNVSTPMVANYSSPTYVYIGNDGNYIPVDFELVSMGEGDYAWSVGEQKYVYMGIGLGSYIASKFEYVNDASGTYKIKLNDEDSVQFNVNQYDLFEMFDMQLNHLLSFDSESTNIFIDKDLIKNSLVYRITSGSNFARLNGGILTVLPNLQTRTVIIEVGFYNFNSNTRFLYVSIPNTGVITAISSEDGELNSDAERIVLNAAADLEYNLLDYIYYGYLFDSYTTSEEPETTNFSRIISSENGENDLLVVYRAIGENTTVSTYVLLNESYFVFSVQLGYEYASISNNKLILNENIPNGYSIVIRASISGITKDIFITVDLTVPEE